MLLKKLRHLEDDDAYNYIPEQIWPLLIDPLMRQSFEKDSCYEIESISDDIGAVGSHWTERHIGEDCAGDVFKWTVDQSDAPHVLQISSPQFGLRQTVTYTLMATNSGSILRSALTYTPILSKQIGKSLLFWSMLASGLLIKFSADPEADAYWSHSLETALDEKHNS